MFIGGLALAHFDRVGDGHEEPFSVLEVIEQHSMTRPNRGCDFTKTEVGDPAIHGLGDRRV